MKRGNIQIRFVTLLIIGLSSCSDDEIRNNNRFEATLTFIPGSPIKFDAVGPKAVMGCSVWGESFVSGTNAAGEMLSLTAVHANFFECIVAPGTFFALCQYQKNYQSPLFTNYPDVNLASLTYTKLTDRHMEGFFTAILRCSDAATCGIDSVVVSGSFKGDTIL